MRAFGIRVLKNGLPVVVLLAALGYGMSQMAEMMTGKSDRPNPDGVPEMRDVLQYRLPFTFAAWGLGFVVAFEALFSLWRKPLPPTDAKPAAVQADEAEQLLMKLLEEADAAERARSMPSPADPTPPPRGGVPVDHAHEPEPRAVAAQQEPAGVTPDLPKRII
jgi:hypothetical protein